MYHILTKLNVVPRWVPITHCCPTLGAILHTSFHRDCRNQVFYYILKSDILPAGGLELGSKAAECWEHIFTACQYVSCLEHALFGHQGSNATSVVAVQAGRTKTVSMLQADGQAALDAKEEETW